MLAGQKIIVVMPAFRAVRTLEQTYRGIDRAVVDEVVLVDDASDDGTAALARSLGLRTLEHPTNRGYGANQKTCYAEALRLGSRMLEGNAWRDGMPLFRYVGNRFLTTVENAVTGAALSEYHTGLRAFSRGVLQTVPFQRNSDGFLFDAEILAQCLHRQFRFAEVSCPTRYAMDSSSIDVPNSIRYGFGVLKVTAALGLARVGVVRPWLE